MDVIVRGRGEPLLDRVIGFELVYRCGERDDMVADRRDCRVAHDVDHAPDAVAEPRAVAVVRKHAELDGRVDTRTEVPFASPASWSAAANALRTRLQIGYLANTNVPYEGR